MTTAARRKYRYDERRIGRRGEQKRAWDKRHRGPLGTKGGGANLVGRAERERMIALRQAGMKAYEIADLTGRSSWTVRKYTKDHAP